MLNWGCLSFVRLLNEQEPIPKAKAVQKENMDKEAGENDPNKHL